MTLRKWRVIDFDAKEREIEASIKASGERIALERQKLRQKQLSARLTKDRWFCEPCNTWHSKAQRRRDCPNYLSIIAWRERYVQRCLAEIERGDEYIDSVLPHVVLNINRWGGEIRRRYLKHPVLGRYLLDERAQLPQGTVGLAGKDDSLSAEQAKLVSDHVPLVKSIAQQFAGKRDWLRDDLETHGLEKLVSLVRDYDPTRGVTFGAFAKRHLMGAMRDYVRDRPRAIAVDTVKINSIGDMGHRSPGGRKSPNQSSEDKWQSASDKRLAELTDGKSALWRRNRERYVSSYWDRGKLNNLTARYLASGGEVKHKTPTLTEDLQRAMAKLNARQQAVYQGRVLTDPPVTRDRLARQLGIRDSTQISRIQRQAERKIARILKPKVSP
jgi:RNA polymerase sigma factor (sigma-70 family)